MLGFCSSPRFVEHQTGPYHPERPDRIRAIYAALDAAGYLASPNPFPDFHGEFGPLPQASRRLVEPGFGPADPQWLTTVHTPDHVDRVRRICDAGGGILDQGDTAVGPASYEIALLAVGAVLRSCDAVMKGEVSRCFAAVRPPGHHAEPDRAMGFCLFNNIAIAARYLQQAYGVARIAIVDFDVHHGNGTQAAFDDDPTVFFISLHQHPRTCYPGSGYDWEIGTGKGRGYTLNIPLDHGAHDAEYLKMIDARVVPELDEFQPEFLLVSAGFDAHQDDPLASLSLSEEGYELITRSLAAVADQHCHGRLVSVLEGGYNLRALGRSVVRHVVGME
jgi:acetoin utilization deacetylase AcuC-like enzyme